MVLNNQQKKDWDETEKQKKKRKRRRNTGSSGVNDENKKNLTVKNTNPRWIWRWFNGWNTAYDGEENISDASGSDNDGSDGGFTEVDGTHGDVSNIN